ncbi:DUF5134 domain-containing protein [Trinickia mobilis]|uniref:DUF5134 domain-containing protein n=1 Tax=Trinickia mobilis TaxID=2816356 RepID=UPI001A8DD611|nr:DUF5134 domain-containing protein [Trinickia mobilis]
MMSPAWLSDILAALMLVVVAVCATRLATARLPTNRLSAAGPTGSRSSPRGSGGADSDLAHLLMCLAMAGMLAPGVKTLPPQAWEAIFVLLTAWFAWRLAGHTKVNGLRSLVSGHRAAHLFHCAAMVYMFAALTASDGMDMTGMGSGMARSLKYPALALAFAFVLVYCSAWDLVGQLSGRRYALGGAPSAGTAPAGDTATTAACRIAVGVTMAFMLLITS